MQPIKEFGAPAWIARADALLPAQHDAGRRFPARRPQLLEVEFLSELSDEAIRTMIDCFARCPTPMGALLLEHFHGAVTRVGATDTAFPHRARATICWCWHSGWTRRTTRLHRLGPRFLCRDAAVHGTGRYVNYSATTNTAMRSPPPTGRTIAGCSVKAKYDPENFFRMNQNIAPAA